MLLRRKLRPMCKMEKSFLPAKPPPQDRLPKVGGGWSRNEKVGCIEQTVSKQKCVDKGETVFEADEADEQTTGSRVVVDGGTISDFGSCGMRG